MKDLFASFGAYNLRARISVGIIFLAPWLLELYLLIPELHNLSSTIIVAIISYGITNVIIVYCRIPGCKAMRKCFPKILPAQEALLPSSSWLDCKTKQRYYSFLSEHVSGFEQHERDSEMTIPTSTAVTWLIAQTRNNTNFPLIAEENINFGFSYNLLGLKPYGLLISFLGLISNGTLFYLYYKQILNIEPKPLIAGFIIDILFLLLWIFIVTKHLVISCGKNYARALLSACDSPHLH